jgi:hypothetical protein
MLLSFRFANHRSFRDEQQLNLTPVYDAEDEQVPASAVPVAGIFGANASGKSNVIGALTYLRSMVSSSDRESEPGVGPRRDPFRLDPAVTRQPSSYAIDLFLDGIRYTYGFTIDDERVTDEWLYSFPLKRKRVIFERSGQSFDWGEESKKSRVRRLEEIVAPAALFLSVAARFEPHDPETGEGDATTSALHALYQWLRQSVTHVEPSSRNPLFLGREYARFLADAEHRSAIVGLLRAADIGLEDVVVPERGVEKAEVRRLLGPLLEDIDEEEFLQNVTNEDFERIFSFSGALAPRRQGPVMFRHRGAVGSVTVGVTDESSGTLRLLELARQAIPVLTSGGLLLVDEIDASLHPLLSAALVRLFQSPAANASNAQLIFTSHDATLLGSIDGEDVLRRDQVWFVSKDEEGASELFPLAEFKPRRQGENREKRYLNGSYGAIPQVSMDLFEQAVASRTSDAAD